VVINHNTHLYRSIGATTYFDLIVSYIIYLHRRTLSTKNGEANDITKVHGDVFKLFGLDHFAGHQLLGDWSRRRKTQIFKEL